MHPWPDRLSSLKCSHRSSKFTFLCVFLSLQSIWALWALFPFHVTFMRNQSVSPASGRTLISVASKKKNVKKRSILLASAENGKCNFVPTRQELSLHSGSVCYFDLEASFWRLIKPHSDLCYPYWTTYFDFAILENENKSEKTWFYTNILCRSLEDAVTLKLSVQHASSHGRFSISVPNYAKVVTVDIY